MEDISGHMELNILISRVLRFLELGIKMQEKKSSKDKEALYCTSSVCTVLVPVAMRKHPDRRS